MVFKKCCITTRTKQERSEPFLEREGFGSFVFGGVPRRTTKASAAHGRAVSAQAQCAADAYFLGRVGVVGGKTATKKPSQNRPALPSLFWKVMLVGYVTAESQDVQPRRV